MIKFNPESIEKRAIEKLQQDPNWNVITKNSVVSSLITSNAEINAETARYAEYLFKETKWDTAQNPSSILSMANMLGYQPKRKISATGKIFISADPRTHAVGKTISFNSFKNFRSNTTDKYNWQASNSNITIDTDSVITDAHGRHYVATPLLFEAGTKQTTLQIIQGEKKSVFLSLDTIRAIATTSKLDPYLYIPVEIKNCENANTMETKAFFRVYTLYTDTPSKNESPWKEYRVVDTLLLSGQGDYDVEVYNDLYSQSLFYLKFNNDSLRGNILDISGNSSIKGIRIDYLETLGSKGNLYNYFENFTISNLKNASGKRLFGINAEAFINGKDEESVYEVKKNAPKYYISNYTAGTREAYENTIKNMQFTVAGKPITNIKSVRVYGDEFTEVSGSKWPITCVSFLADNLEDLFTNAGSGDYSEDPSGSSSDKDPYTAIDEALNYYLARLKSPQDTLKFVPPKYVPFAIGVNCVVDRTKVEDIAQLENDIRDMLDYYYGSNSDSLNFGRAISPSTIITQIKNTFKAVNSVDVELEAISKLNWSEGKRMAPKSDTEQSTIRHTIRVPFSFSPIFIGTQTNKGFKDYRVSAGYVMRIDVMYKKPNLLPTKKDFNVSIFIQDDLSARQFIKDNATKLTNSFYLVKDITEAGIWEKDFGKASTDYDNLKDISKLSVSQQYYYKKQSYNDNDYKTLIDDSSEGYTPTLDSEKVANSDGTIPNYLVYFSADYTEGDSSIGEGWLELPFDSLHNMMTKFAQYDSRLRERLEKCDLSLLECGTSDIKDTFEAFRSVLSDYVDIYVSMRPVDPHLVIRKDSKESNSSVLYVDSYDSADAKKQIQSLTISKRPRMLSVKCKYEE